MNQSDLLVLKDLHADEPALAQGESIGPAGIESEDVVMDVFHSEANQSDLLVLKVAQVRQKCLAVLGNQSDLLVLKGAVPRR